MDRKVVQAAIKVGMEVANGHKEPIDGLTEVIELITTSAHQDRWHNTIKEPPLVGVELLVYITHPGKAFMDILCAYNDESGAYWGKGFGDKRYAITAGSRWHPLPKEPIE